jgi:hypothetical protein
MLTASGVVTLLSTAVMGTFEAWLTAHGAQRAGQPAIRGARRQPGHRDDGRMSGDPHREVTDPHAGIVWMPGTYLVEYPARSPTGEAWLHESRTGL